MIKTILTTDIIMIVKPHIGQIQDPIFSFMMGLRVSNLPTDTMLIDPQAAASEH